MATIIDLHMHSTCSDGVLTPTQMIDKAVANKVKYLSIADHDTIMAYTPEFFEYAKSKGITLIPAVEMSTKFEGIGVHLLGYSFDITNSELLSTLDSLINSRQNYLLDVAKKLNELGYNLNVAELQKVPSVTKANIAMDITSNKANEKLLLQNFGHIPSKGEFIETIMNKGCPAYVEKYNISPVDASRIIHKAGGKVVIAHPVAYRFEDDMKVSWVQHLVDEVKPDGIEANYLYINRYDELIDEVGFWRAFAEKNNLFTTIGSDYHNSDSLHPEIGFSNYEFTLTDKETEAIYKNITKKR